MLPGGRRIICMICMIWGTFSGLDLYYTDPQQPLTTAGEELDGLDHDLSDLSVRCVEFCEVVFSHIYDEGRLRKRPQTATPRVRTILINDHNFHDARAARCYLGTRAAMIRAHTLP